MRGQFYPGFTKVLYTDIADTTFFETMELLNGGFASMPEPGSTPTIDVQPISENIGCSTSNAEISFRYKGHIDVAKHGAAGYGAAERLLLLYLPNGLDDTNPASYTLLYDELLYITSDRIFDRSATVTTAANAGDRFWFVVFGLFNVAEDWDSYVITEDTECFFKMGITSLCDPSPCKTYMLHEAASRIIENVTNNQLHFRSNYFGRTDSLPYAYDADGCGGLRSITNGLQIRRAVLTDGTNPKVFTNWGKLLDSINAADHVGYGAEGNDIRTEPVQYFYKDAVVFVADGVASYKKKVRTDRIWNQFNFGYDKYETESTNGLDAIHTKRQFRIPLINTSAVLEKTCPYILDGYAEEVTRRKYGSTDDWRYDQDIFMFCLKRGETDVEVEQGNIDSPLNMFDPATVINFRLRPMSNFMRWFNWITQGIRQIDAALTQLLFNSGDGNYVASGKLQSADCVEEAAAIAENDPLFENRFAVLDDAKPFIVPEEVTFTFPLGLNEFLWLKQNMYGKIQYRRDEDDAWKFGWITKLEPHHEDGDATFTLVTAKYGTPITPEDANYIITEGGLVIDSEGGGGLITEN
jgi:hypothetical protein